MNDQNLENDQTSHVDDRKSTLASCDTNNESIEKQNTSKQANVDDKVGSDAASTPADDSTSGMDRQTLRPDKCHFYLKRKCRYCRTTPNKDSIYCVEHSHVLKLDDGKRRIQCPLDAKHTCYEDQLKKHLRKCNANQDHKLEYYSKDINAGEVSSADLVEKKSITELSPDEIQNMVHKVTLMYKNSVPEPKEEILFHEALREETDKATNGPAAQKHLQQQASLVGHMDKLGLLKDQTCYIEFGAGKGGLSHWIQRAVADNEGTRFILVERGGVRYKKDNYHRGEDQGPTFERMRVDIKHLNLANVKSLQDCNKPIVGTGKHLCGGATDLMLRCLVETKASLENSSGTVEGIVLALCCHHRCDWQTYVGKKFFSDHSLTAQDFQLFTSMTSWATCATRTFLDKINTKTQVDTKSGASQSHTAEPEHQSPTVDVDYDHPKYGKMTPEEREIIGYMCKKIIDMGRIHYLRDKGYDTRLACYTEKEFSLENVVLLATKKTDD